MITRALACSDKPNFTYKNACDAGLTNTVSVTLYCIQVNEFLHISLGIDITLGKHVISFIGNILTKYSVAAQTSTRCVMSILLGEDQNATRFVALTNVKHKVRYEASRLACSKQTKN